MNQYKEKVLNIDESANIWMHRCNHYGDAAWKMLGYNYASKNFTNENGCYISIGCSSGAWTKDDYEKIDFSKDKWKAFEEKYNADKPRYRFSLYRFFFAFQKNDYIVVPSSGEFHVFQIESDEILTYDDEIIQKRFHEIGLDLDTVKKNQDNFKFFRKVIPIRVQIPRKGYAVGELCAKLKFYGTTIEIKDNAAEILKKALKAEKPFSIYDNSSIKMAGILYENALKKITPDGFENLIAWYFKKKGADVYDILSKNYAQKVETEDTDVMAVFEDLKIRIFVQAKAYLGTENDSVDLSSAIEQINKYEAYHFSEFEKGYTNIKWIICLAKSNDAIKDFKKITSNTNENIRIINGTEFAEMLLNAGIQNIDEALEK